MKKKQLYESPETKLIQVIQTHRFLNGSITATRSNYIMDVDEEWED